MHCDDSTITIIAKLSKSIILPPGTIITREDTFCTELYFIIRGYCKAESEIPTDKYHQNYTTMTIGDCFPIMEMLLGIRTFLKVTALTFVELISVPHTEFTVHLKRSLGFYEDLQYVLEEHMREYHIVLTRQKGRLPAMISKIKSEGVGDYFVYETNEEVGVKDDRTFEKTFNLLGKFMLSV